MLSRNTSHPISRRIYSDTPAIYKLSLVQVFYQLEMRPPCPDFKMPYNSRKSTRSRQRSNRPATYYHGHYFMSHTNKKKGAAWAEGAAPQALTAFSDPETRNVLECEAESLRPLRSKDLLFETGLNISGLY